MVGGGANNSPTVFMPFQVPDQLFVLTPLGQSALRGSHVETKNAKRHIMQMRVTYPERKAIERARDLCGCTSTSEYIRQIIMSTTRYLLREEEKYYVKNPDERFE